MSATIEIGLEKALKADAKAEHVVIVRGEVALFSKCDLA